MIQLLTLKSLLILHDEIHCISMKFSNLLQLTENSDMLKHTMDSCPSLERMLPSLHSMYEKVMVENTSLKEQASTYSSYAIDIFICALAFMLARQL